MKIECDICHKAEAEVLCSADEAVLCKECDEEVHAANKLSQKHERLFLVKHISSSSSTSSLPLPPCDSCQERKGNLFCLEDRAIMCGECDISNHSQYSRSPFVLSHQRFLITGIEVGENSRKIQWPSVSSIQNSKELMTMNLGASTDQTTASFSNQSHLPFVNDIFIENTDINFYELSEFDSSPINH